MEDEIIQLDAGFKEIKEKGILPFIRFVESGDQEFFSAHEFVMLYDLLFKMCIQRDPYNWSEEMYDKYVTAIRTYQVDSVRPEMTKAKNGAHEAAFLKEWERRWNNHVLIVRGLSKLFMYLDRFHTPNTDGVLSLKLQGFKLYKDEVFDHLRAHARQCILNAIQRERENEEQDRHLLSLSVQCFTQLGFNMSDGKLRIYKTELEKHIVRAAGEYYKRVSRQWLAQDSCPTYLEKAESSINKEKARVESYLNQATMEPLTRETYIQLLRTHQKELLDKEGTGISHLLEAERYDDLARLYRLYAKYPDDLAPIGAKVHDHIRRAGRDVVDKAQPSKAGPDSDHSLVRNLIDLHDRYARMVRECFGNSQVFQKALKTAFEAFINSDNRVSTLLAKFVNDVLKRGTKMNQKDIDSTLDNVVFLYGYITEKDVFERNYSLYLARRLLMGLCESEHAEKSMIAKLKSECGYQWTSRLEGMFKDVQLSKDLMAKFKRSVGQAQEAKGLQLEVTVCTTGYWPSQKIIKAKIPAELAPMCDRFRAFYLNQHAGHKIDWRMDQGKAEVQVHFSKAVKRGLVLSTYQMMILLVFNSASVVTFKQIVEITGVPRNELANHLLSLAHPKVKVLMKKPNNKELADGHKFMINGKFTSPLLKVQVPLLKTSGPVSGEDDDAEQKAINLQRRHQMDASIVRIMKTRKTLRHNQLVGEVITQLSARFKPKPTMIKKRIEALIEMEYLKRDDNDRSVYNYLA